MRGLDPDLLGFSSEKTLLCNAVLSVKLEKAHQGFDTKPGFGTKEVDPRP
jgi:hypothetical protein